MSWGDDSMGKEPAVQAFVPEVRSPDLVKGVPPRAYNSRSERGQMGSSLELTEQPAAKVHKRPPQKQRRDRKEETLHWPLASTLMYTARYSPALCISWEKKITVTHTGKINPMAATTQSMAEVLLLHHSPHCYWSKWRFPGKSILFQVSFCLFVCNKQKPGKQRSRQAGNHWAISQFSF